MSLATRSSWTPVSTSAEDVDSQRDSVIRRPPDVGRRECLDDPKSTGSAIFGFAGLENWFAELKRLVPTD